MSAVRRMGVLALVLVLGLGGVGRTQNPRPLSEADLTKLIELQVGDDAVIARVERSGVDFVTDSAAMQRLQQAGASAAVLAAVRKAGQPASAITYDGILKLIRQGTNEEEILKQLQDSPTTFTLDRGQIGELVRAGASPRLIEALQQLRSPVSQGSDIGDFAVVLDCSGSMKELTPDGSSKMDAAKQVVTRFLRDIPDGKRLALIVYGVTSTNNRAASCRDVQVVLKLSPLNAAVKEQLAQYIAAIQPFGMTPLALALETAGDQLAAVRGLSQLVLITDGMETCGGDPGRVAEELTRKLSLPHGVDVVGFGVAPQEQRAVQAIVARGRGHYYDARTAQELDRALRAAVVKPVEVKTNQGEALQFSSPEGSWADRVVSFRPGENVPDHARDPNTVLGRPDYDSDRDSNYVALGLGGELILEFTDNALVDIDGPDLAIFEIGPAAESVRVAISVDGRDWVDIGRTTGGKSTLDIAPFVRPGQRFRFVKLTDPGSRKSDDGADIDAVGALGSIAATGPK